MTEVALRDRLRERGLWPHQADFVETVVASDPGTRFLLGDDPGLGKTGACAASLGELAQVSPGTFRFAVLAPMRLLHPWVDSLRDFGELSATIVDPSTYRRLELETPLEKNPWTSIPSIIVSLDFVKREERARQFVAAGWDVVVIDEAHLCRTASQRGFLLDLIWKSPVVSRAIAATATPHSGHVDDFEPLVDSRTKIVRRAARDLVDWNGEPILAVQRDRLIERVPVAYSESEMRLFEALRSLGSSPRNEFALMVVLRRASSSLFAVDQSLRRLAARGTETSNWVAEFWEDTDLLAVSPHAAAPPDWPSSDVQRVLNLVEAIELDSKWNACAKTLDGALADHEHVVVFAEFNDTCFYLNDLLRSAGRRTELLVGSMSPAERPEAVDRFREKGGILVTTASEGVSYEFVKACIHYDLPWSPAGLMKRFGRVNRINKPPGPVVHYFLVDEVFRPLEKTLGLESIGDEERSLLKLVLGDATKG